MAGRPKIASSYPSTYDALTNPTASDKTNSATVPHATQHSNLNDIAEALERRVGLHSTTLAGSSAPSSTSRIGDVLSVRSTSGHTAWGPFTTALLGDQVATSSGLATFSFTGIPAGYTHLRLYLSGRGAGVSTSQISCGLQMNASTGASYELQLLASIGSAASAAEVYNSTTGRSAQIPGGGCPAGFVGGGVVDIFDYANGAMHKMAMTTHGSKTSTASTGTMRTTQAVTFFNSTAPITQIDVPSPTENYATGSRATLFGMASSG